MLGSAMDVFAIAAVCTTRGLTPDETTEVHSIICDSALDPAAISAGEAQLALESAIDAVLSRTRGLRIFDEHAESEDDPIF